MRIKFPCWHKYRIIYAEGPHQVRCCKKCGKLQSTVYDMCYGEIYWANGNLWMEPFKIEVTDTQYNEKPMHAPAYVSLSGIDPDGKPCYKTIREAIEIINNEERS